MDVPALTLGLGFVLGLKHALDADHLVAISTIVSEQRNLWRSSLIGIFWGLGHTLSLALVGIPVIVLRLTISQQAAFWMEMAVAVMLVALGSRLVLKSLRHGGWHAHVHSHGEVLHSHTHAHPGGATTHEDTHHRMSKLARLPLFVGMVHGLAGSAALMLLVLATIPTTWGGVVYVVIFGVGSIGGMLVMSTLISLPLTVLAQRYTQFAGRIHMVAGVTSVAFGIFLAFQLASA